MLQVGDGTIRIKGSAPDMLYELTLLLREIKELLEKDGNEQRAKEAIMLAGKLAFMEDGDLDDLMEKAPDEILRGLGICR